MFDEVFVWLSEYVRHSFAGVIALFTDEKTGPFLAGVILAFGIVFFVYILLAWLAFSTILRSAARTITKRSIRLANSSIRFEELDKRLSAMPRISESWRQLRETIIKPENTPATLSPLTSNSAGPAIFFNLPLLRMNYAFTRHMPNIFVGLGLLGTFLGLIAALTAALSSFNGSPTMDGPQQAILNLLRTASAKFYVSAAALAVSIILTFSIRVFGSNLVYLITRLNKLLETQISFINVESIARRQLDIHEQQLLQLRTFNTELAMTVGRSVREAISESNGALIARLQGVAETFANLVQASREGAGEAISKAMESTITGTLNEATSTIRTLVEGLAEFPAKLALAGDSFNAAGAANAQLQTQFADQAHAQTKDITSVMTGISDAQAGLQKQILEAAGAITSATDQLQNASRAVGQQIESISAGIGKLQAISADMSNTVREAQAQIKANIESLGAQWARHSSRFDGVDAKMAETLGKLSEQVTFQTSQMREQVAEMNSALAKAVGTFEVLIEDLVDQRNEPMRERVA